jgi:tRNA(adenine34) deaminase
MYVKSGDVADGLWIRLEAPWRAAVEEAWAAYAAGTVPVGAVLVDPTGRVVSRGRNRIFEASAPGQIAGSRLAHAEVNALLGLAGSEIDPRVLALYTTAEPCPLCVGALVMANVREIRYAAREPFAGSLAVLNSTAYIRNKAISVRGPHDPVLEGVLAVIGMEFHLRRAGPRVAELVALSSQLRPDAGRLAARMHADRRWDRLREMTAAEGLSEVVAGLDL